jgi:hypothetical protein
MSDISNAVTPSESMSIESIRDLFSDESVETKEGNENEKTNEETSSEEQSEESSSEEKQEGLLETADSPEKDDTPEESVKVLEEPGEVNFKPKKFVFKAGDDAHEVPNDAVVEIPVDGGVRKIHLQEVINRASGDISVENRITEIEKTRKEFDRIHKEKENLLLKEVESKKSEIKKSQETLEKLAKLTTEGKPEELLAYCARLTGKDPVDTLSKFLDDSVRWAKALDTMDDASRETWLQGVRLAIKQQEIAEKEESFKREDEARRTEKEKAELASFAMSELQKADVPQEEFASMVKHLTEHNVQLNAEDDRGKFKEVLEYVLESRIFAAAKEVDASLLQNQELLQSVFDYASVRNIRKMSDIKRIIAGLAEDSKKKEAERIAENLSRKEPKATTQRASKANSNEEKPVLTLNDYFRKRLG